MFRRNDEKLGDNEIDQGSLLGGNIDDEAENNASASTSGSSSSTGSSGYGSSNAPSSPVASNSFQSNPSPRPAAETLSRPQGPLPAALNPFRSAPAQTQEPAPRARSENKPASAFTAPAKESRRVLTVGSDILLKGEIATCDRLVIEGKVDAVLNDVGTVELAESGSFKGIAQVENAEISGLFEGELMVKNRLVIYGSGRVRGKISYGEVEIERGGELTGEIQTINNTNSRNKAKEEKPVAA